MIFSFLNIWAGNGFGFMILGVDKHREDDLVYALLGVAYNKDERVIGIDFFWKYFEIKLR